MIELLIATNNPGKLAEFAQMFSESPLKVRSLADVGISADVEETGETFAENAAIKAAFYARLSGISTLADDSGLVIDHLKGEPGVRSARYAGEGAGDNERIRKVLAKMSAAGDRSARFIAVCALAEASGKIVHTTEGTCEGSIAFEPRGANGFGYDPIFLPTGFDQTFAEMPSEIKHSISHRALAVKKMIPFLRGFFNI